MKTIIIGAGMSGLTAAHHLIANGHDVVILDKGRGVGGRLATRRIGDAILDHGAQFFTATSAAFRQRVAEWKTADLVHAWNDGYPPHPTIDGGPRYRVHGGMNALAKHLASDLKIETNQRVSRIETNGSIRVETETGHTETGDQLIITAPAPQSIDLLEASNVSVPPLLRAITYERCLGLLAVLDGPSNIPPPGCAAGDDNPIAFIADNHAKGISSVSAVTIHAAHDFSFKHYEEADDVIRDALTQAAQPWLGSPILESQVKRWKFCKPITALPDPYLQHPEHNIRFAGDAFGGPARLETAFLSGLAAGGE